MRIVITIFAALLGLAFGSFLNVCLSRWPAGESIAQPRSHCRTCGRTLAWWENLPVLSWIFLAAKCRTCGNPISLRYPLVECATGLLWAYVCWTSAPLVPAAFLPLPAVLLVCARAALQMALLWMLLALAFLDAEHLWLPDFLTLPGIALGLIMSTFLAHTPFLPFHASTLLKALLTGVLGAAVAAGLILFIRWTYRLLRQKEGIGLGDAKLMALLAAWLGLPGALLSFVIGVILGAGVAFVLLLLPKRNDAPAWAMTRLPLGTFLCLGGIVSNFWGPAILAVYLRWIGLQG